MSGPTWETVGMARASRMRGTTGLGPGIRSSFSSGHRVLRREIASIVTKRPR